MEMPKNRYPKRIIVVRSGENEGNLETTTPDREIPLTALGIQQAQAAGERISNLISQDAQSPNWKVYFYVSPYKRTLMTLREIGRPFLWKKILGVVEDDRIEEQDFGNLQVEERMKVIEESKERSERFSFRFPRGESADDVHRRICCFFESLWKAMEINTFNDDNCSDVTLIIVSHGLTCRVFLMKLFAWTVNQFERLNDLENCEFRVMQLGAGGRYSLAIHHTREEMVQWRLSDEMIVDQERRASGQKGKFSDCPWCLASFFDYFAASEDEGEEDA